MSTLLECVVLYALCHGLVPDVVAWPVPSGDSLFVVFEQLFPALFLRFSTFGWFACLGVNLYTIKDCPVLTAEDTKDWLF